MTDGAPGAPIRVLIVDDHEMFGSSLGMALQQEPDIRVVGIATTGAMALQMARSEAPDVVLLDQRLPDTEGVSLIGPILAVRPTAQAVMVTASTSDQTLISAIEAGAAGFVDKSRSLEEVILAVRSAAAGESLVSPRLLARLLPRLRRQENDASTALTTREREVLDYVAQGMSNADIAAQMSVSVHTVRNHVGNLSG
jgi:DNA-binding NarL/FixJ family response regulator